MLRDIGLTADECDVVARSAHVETATGLLAASARLLRAGQTTAGALRAAGAAVVVGPPGGAGALFPGRCRGCGCVLLCAGSRDRVFFFFRLSHS